MGARMWTAAGLGGGLLIVGGGWYAVAGTASSTHAVCGADLTKDPVVASEFPDMAVVEVVENTRGWDNEGGSSFLTSEVKSLKTLKGSVPEQLTLTQGVTKGGTAAGKYVNDDPLYAVLEPGKQYVVGIETMDSDGQGPWAGYVTPAKRGVEGEAAHWRDAQKTAVAPVSACHDIVND